MVLHKRIKQMLAPPPCDYKVNSILSIYFEWTIFKRDLSEQMFRPQPAKAIGLKRLKIARCHVRQRKAHSLL